jgi:chromate reductase, NAD(P)H dehydrogenase (quinone)
MKTIMIFSGSNSSTSIHNEILLFAQQYIKHATPLYVSLTNYEAPIYSADGEVNHGIPASMHALLEVVNKADAFVIACPEHNGSMTAVFKNTIDWLSRIQKNIFQNKPVFLITASPGAQGGSTVHASLLQLLPRWGSQLSGSLKLPNYSNMPNAAAYFSQHASLQDALILGIAELEQKLK